MAKTVKITEEWIYGIQVAEFMLMQLKIIIWLAIAKFSEDCITYMDLWLEPEKSPNSRNLV
jgi:hypothetical protein